MGLLFIQTLLYDTLEVSLGIISMVKFVKQVSIKKNINLEHFNCLGRFKMALLCFCWELVLKKVFMLFLYDFFLCSGTCF